MKIDETGRYMKKLFLLFPLLIFIGCSKNDHTYPAADAPIQIMGRHIDKGKAVSFAASGVTFFMKFHGTHLDVQLEDEFRDSTNYNWFTVIVDGGKASRFRTQQNKYWYTLADSLSDGEHTLILSKATEGQNGHNQLVSIRTATLLNPDPLPKRTIEFIGDSITSGYGLDARIVPCGEGPWFDQTHAWLAYGPRTARHFDAKWMLSSVSGIGMHRNWNSPSPVMPDVYDGVYMEYTDSVTPWNFDSYTPDLVLIALGTNDFSDGGGKEPRPALDGKAFVNDYTSFIGTVRAEYPEAKIMLLNSPMLDKTEKATLDGYLHQVVDNRKALGDSAITQFAFPTRYTDGCGGHPDLEQQAKMAEQLEPVVQSFMDW